MVPIIRLPKRLILSCIGIYLTITFFIVCMQANDQNFVYHYTFNHFVFRLIMCCIPFMYVYLQKIPNTKFTIIPPYINRKKLIIDTVLLQLIITGSLLLLSSIQESLWNPTIQPILHFSSKIDFLYRGIIEIIFLTAILEEIICRHILEKILHKIIPIRLCITLISALTFTLMHGDMHNNLSYFVTGCFLSYLYYKTKHIIYPIIAHGLHNLYAILIIYLRLDDTLEGSIDSLTVTTRITLVIGIILIAYTYGKYIMDQPKIKSTI